MKIGIYNPHLLMLGGGEKSTCVFAELLSSENEVYILTHSPFSKEVLEQTFSVNLSRVSICVIELSFFLKFLTDPTKRLWKIRNVIGQAVLKNKFKSFNMDVFINHCHASYLPAPAPIGIYMCMFPQRLYPDNIVSVRGFYEYCVNGISYALNKGSFLSSYQHIWANSEYTKNWIRQYWNRDAMVLYPPCENIGIGKEEKKRIILSVGRFFYGDHNKRQDFMIESFKKLNRFDCELHIAGSLREDMHSSKYVARLQTMVNGFPISLHFNMSFEKLRDLYRKSMIYWHAAGYGEREDYAPHKVEHFGITTVEAMSAGVVPVVIALGGQPEIVEDGISGFLWSSPEELLLKTNRLLDDEKMFLEFSRSAVERSRAFSKELFNEQLLSCLRDIIKNTN